MLTLYDNPFSPFARKVRMVLRLKGLAFQSIDALARNQHAGLRTVSTRAEVPVLVDADVTIADSADIVAYLDDRYQTPAVLPSAPALRAKARRWHRVADTLLDAIIHDVSIWAWPTHRRTDEPPEGLLEAGRSDLAKVLDELERAIDAGPFVCGELSIADIALFPHVSSFKPLGVLLDETQHPRLVRWHREMRLQPIVRADLDEVKQRALEKFVDKPSPYESEKIVWRGDRLEWLLANGFASWLDGEMRAGRVVFPRSI